MFRSLGETLSCQNQNFAKRFCNTSALLDAGQKWLGLQNKKKRFVKILYPRPPVLSASGSPTKSSPKILVRKMPVFCILRKSLTFKRIQKFGSDFRLIFENPSHFSAIFRLRNVKISLRNFRISLRNSGIALSNPKISLLDFRRVKIFAEIPQICVLF